MNQQIDKQYDCVVIGGGPGGCATAAIVAQAGFKTLLLEREKMPRFHIGESLMPETYWAFERIGVLDKMKQGNFVTKLSVQFVSHSGKESQPFFFPEHDPHESSRTWQVERASFDEMLFHNAAEKGACCRDQSRVLDVLMEGDKATGVRVAQDSGAVREISARVIVDATGLQSFMANRLGLKVEDPKLRKAAIWGYYENARRDSGDNAGATIILHTNRKDSWFWFIPLPNNVTSIGVVGDNQYLLKGRGKPAEVFEDELVKCPALVERLMEARLVSEFRTAKEFTYSTTRQSGEGWVLVGDAFGFIDPIYSSGVFLALRSGVLAGDAIVEGLQSDNVSGAQLGKWAPEFKQGVEWIRKLVYAFYTNPFSFGDFMRKFPQHRGNLVDLLIGRVFSDQAGRIFDDMQPMIQQMLQMSSHTDEKVSVG